VPTIEEDDQPVKTKQTQGTLEVYKQVGHRGAARWPRCKVGSWVDFIP